MSFVNCNLQPAAPLARYEGPDFTCSPVAHALQNRRSMQTLTSPMNSNDGAMRKPTHDEIAGAAYRLYLEQGTQHGHDLDDWLRAEQLLQNQFNESVTRQHSMLPMKAEKENTQGVHALDHREHPFARDERGAADREEIRRKTTPFRSASRQTRPAGQGGKTAARAEARQATP